MSDVTPETAKSAPETTNSAPETTKVSPEMTSPEPAPKKHRRRPPAWLLRTAVSLLCVAATAWWVSAQPTPKFPTSASSIALILTAAGVTLLLAVLRGWRWARILSAVGFKHLGVEPYALTAVGYMGNTVLPARGGDFIRVGLLARRQKGDWKTIAGTLIPERLLDVIALALALIALSLSGSARDRLGAWPAVFAFLGVLGISVVVIGYRELRVRGYFESIADKVRPFTRATRVLLDRRGAGLLLLSLGLWGLEALVLWLVVDAAYDQIPFFAAAFVVVLASLATAIPAAPGFIGTLDAAVIFGLSVAGVPADETFALAVLYRLVLFGPITIVGAIILVFRYGLSAVRLRSGDPHDEGAAAGADGTSGDGPGATSAAGAQTVDAAAAGDDAAQAPASGVSS